jgi:hypothetical protein
MEKEREYKMSDVVAPSTSRTIRRVPINRKQVEKEEVVEEYVRPRRAQSATRDMHSKKGNGLFTKITLVAVVLISIVSIAAAISLAYARGTLTIVPKKVDSSINIPFAANPSGEGLKYITINASDTAVEVVPSKPGAFYQSKAKGNATITNTSTDEQQLVVNTRLETATGKIFRITKPVVISAGKHISVPIIADESGADWNITKAEAGKMKIPGFKGSKKYDQFYAELDEDVTGGFSGNKNVIDEQVYKETRDRLSASVTELVKAKLRSQIDANSVFYDSLVTVKIEELPQLAKGTAQSQISIKGTGMAYVFDKNELTRVLGANEVKKLGSNTFKAIGIEKIAVSSKTPLKFSPTATLNLSAVGDITLVGDVPVDGIKKELLGIKISDLNTVLKKYDSIGKASVKISPFWKKTFPNTVDRIDIEVSDK